MDKWIYCDIFCFFVYLTLFYHSRIFAHQFNLVVLQKLWEFFVCRELVTLLTALSLLALSQTFNFFNLILNFPTIFYNHQQSAILKRKNCIHDYEALKIIYICIEKWFTRIEYWVDSKYAKVGRQLDKLFYIYLMEYHTAN